MKDFFYHPWGQWVATLAAILALSSPGHAQTVAGGSGHSLFVCATGNVQAIGSNNNGQLGDGTSITLRTSPVQVSGLSNVVAVAANYETSLFLKADGTVWGCGNNNNGELGNGVSSVNNRTPIQIMGLSGVKAISKGRTHCLFLKTDGTVWACGGGPNGTIGNGQQTQSNLTVVRVGTLTGIVAIAAGALCSLFLQNNGTVWACGQSGFGELGMPGSHYTPTRIPSLSGIVAIATSPEVNAIHSLFVKNDGTVWATGENLYGELGVGTPGPTAQVNIPLQISGLTNVQAVAIGRSHSLFLKRDGTAWACGYNANGQLGDGTTINRNTPVPVAGGGRYIGLAKGNNYSFFLKSDRTVWACGNNLSRNLGNGNNITQPTPVQSSAVCSLALASASAKPITMAAQLYPVPTNGPLRLKATTQEALRIELLDTQGKLVKTFTVNGPEEVLEIGDLLPGLYLARISGRNNVTTQKVVRQ